MDLSVYFRCIRESGSIAVSAHRGGASIGFPENSLAAINRHSWRDVQLIEIDISKSADGVLFLHHDRTLDRTTTLNGPVSEADWTKIQEARLRDKSGHIVSGVPVSLSTALKWFRGPQVLQLDIKPPAKLEEVVNVVESVGAIDRVVFLLFDTDDIRALQRSHPAAVITTAGDELAYFKDLIDSGLSTDQLQAIFLGPDINTRLLRELKTLGILTLVSAVPEEMRFTEAEIESSAAKLYAKYFESQADVIVSDYPRVVAREARRLGVDGC